MLNRIRFSLPKENEEIFLVLKVCRSNLDKKLTQISFSAPKEFSTARFGLIEKDQTLSNLAKYILSINGKVVSIFKILGLITCEINSQRLNSLLQREEVEFIDRIDR